MSISEMLKSNAKEAQAKELASTSNNNNNSNNGHCNNPGCSNSNSTSNNLKSSSSMKPPTKVKSGSWKRSEKQISSYSTISGKKSKSLRKRSPTWLKFPNTPVVKLAEKVSGVGGSVSVGVGVAVGSGGCVGANDTTSVCRPGTLYSDVLFGAGSSCLVKIKTLTPRRTTNNAQKKLTKALIKCKANEHESTACSDAEAADRELFPSLNEFGKVPSVCSASAYPAKTPATKRDGEEGGVSGVEAGSQEQARRVDDGADVVIISESHGVQNAENGVDEVSYGSYLEHHFRQVNGMESSRRPDRKPFTIEIPEWNFIDANLGLEAYPKFLCQFEDEHYLKAEKMALLGLKLALGNNTNQGKFKF